MTDNNLFDDIDDDLDGEASENDILLVPGSEESDQEMYEHYRFTADKGQSPMRVDRYLAMHIVNVSRNRIQQAADAECILVNGTSVKSNYKIKPCDLITMVMNRPPRDLEIIPQDIPIDVVYEDKDLIVVNKAPGMVVHPGFGNFEGTLVNAIAWRLKDSPEFDGKDPRLGVVHRIDKDTSGLLVAAMNPHAKADLSSQFFHKTTKRQYIALVWGDVKENEGTIEGNIGRHLKDRLQMTVFPEGDQGKPAITHYKVLERLGYVTLVQCQLETGRTHQIRVHMKYIGHTLFNDTRYGGNEILRGTNFTKYRQFIHNCFEICPRQALHAKTLGFVHPATKEEMLFEAPIPEDIQLVLEKWRGYIASR